MLAPPAFANPGALFDPELNENPHPFLAKLRAEHPISRVGDSGVHLVATWALIDEALEREADFSANLTGVLIRDPTGQPTTFDLPYAGGTSVIATADEPSHSVHRALTQPRLAASRIPEFDAPIREMSRDALEPWLRAGGGDFVPISEIVPARVVARLLGLPDGDVSHFRTWAMMGGDMLAGDIDGGRLAELGAETGRMARYLHQHLEAAQRDMQSGPEAPLLHALARGVQDSRIDAQEAVGIAIVMFGAGGESTAALIGSAMRLLAEDPELADQLRASPALIPRFVEETVRLEPPFKFHYRAVRRPCELGGCELQTGDRLMLLWSSANRDADVFEDPDALRLDRRHPKKHLGFGRGGHFCIGAPLARLEARAVVEYALARTRRIRLLPEAPPAHAQSLFVRRLERLPTSVELAPER